MYMYFCEMYIHVLVCIIHGCTTVDVHVCIVCLEHLVSLMARNQLKASYLMSTEQSPSLSDDIASQVMI